MIINQQEQTLKSNIKTESTSFGIGDISTVIDILRNRLYSNPIQTLVQEYICNARDAMREAGSWGNTKLIIGVPNFVKPVFSVRDFGLGLTPERVQKVFVLYGASTKRDNNNQTGGFGIGAKSAWSYTDSFTVTTFVDGIKRVYVAHLGTNNVGSFDLISETPTDEANGTMIEVAVKSGDVHNFVSAIQRCIYFWKEPIEIKGTTDLSRATVQFESDDIIVLDNRCEFLDWYGHGLLIDGVIYPWRDEHSLSNKPYVLKFNTGELEVSASREEITKSTINFNKIKEKRDRLTDLSNQKVKELKTKKSIQDVIKFQEEFSWLLAVTRADVEIDDCRYCDNLLYVKTSQFTAYRKIKKGYITTTTSSINLKAPLLVDDKTLKQNDKARRIKSFVSQRNEIYVVDSVPACLSHNTYMSISDLPFIAPPPKKAKVNSVSPDHVAILGDSQYPSIVKRLTTPLDKNDKYCFFLKKQSINSDWIDVASLLGYKILRVTLVGEKQVKKQIPDIKTITDVIIDYIDSNLDEIVKIQPDDTSFKLLSMKELQSEIGDICSLNKNVINYTLRNCYSIPEKLYEAKRQVEVKVENMKKKYPLLTRLNLFTYSFDNHNLINECKFYIQAKQGGCQCQ